MIGGNAGGSGVSYCPPIDNSWFQDPFYVERPYNPDYDQPDNSLYTATPYALSEFRGYQMNRDIDLTAYAWTSPTVPALATYDPSTGQTVNQITGGTGTHAGWSSPLTFTIEYNTPDTSSFLTIEMVSTVTWASIDTFSDDDGTVTNNTTSVTRYLNTGSTTFTYYINFDANTGSTSRSFTLDVLIEGDCYAGDDDYVRIQYTQPASSGSGGSGGGGGLGENTGGGNQ
jgi:hypothetical protein